MSDSTVGYNSVVGDKRQWPVFSTLRSSVDKNVWPYTTSTVQTAGKMVSMGPTEANLDGPIRIQFVAFYIYLNSIRQYYIAASSGCHLLIATDDRLARPVDRLCSWGV